VVELVGLVREVERFPTLDALVVQMHKDAAEARQILHD
jgi:FAD synthase